MTIEKKTTNKVVKVGKKPNKNTVNMKHGCTNGARKKDIDIGLIKPQESAQPEFLESPADMEVTNYEEVTTQQHQEMDPTPSCSQREVTVTQTSTVLLTQGESVVIENDNAAVHAVKKNKVNLNKYNHLDQGPFIVFVETLKITPDSNSINDIKVGRLMKMKQLHNYIIDLKVTGRHRVKINFSNKDKANQLINDNNLVIDNLKAYVPDQFVQRIGIVKNIDTEISDDELMEHLSCKNGIQIKEITRFLKKTKDENNMDIQIKLRTLKITFQGQLLPDEVEIYNVKRKVLPYLFTVTQCFGCGRYGHTKKNCKNKKKTCANCGEEEHKNPEEKCTRKSYCVNCKGSHKSTDKECAEFIRQSAMKKLMSLNNLSYWEANEKFPKTKNQYQVFENLEDFPELPELNKNQNKMFNKEIEKTNRMYHIIYKRKNNGEIHDWKQNRTEHFKPLTEEWSETTSVVSHNPHKTTEVEKLRSEVLNIQKKIEGYMGKDESDNNPATLDSLLIDIGVYLKTSLDYMSEQQKNISEHSQSRK